MYKNIIFDLGGVVVDFKPRDFLMDHFLNKRAEDEVFDLTFGSKEWEEHPAHQQAHGKNDVQAEAGGLPAVLPFQHSAGRD